MQNKDAAIQKIIGKASFVDFDAFSTWYKEQGKEYYSYEHLWSNCLYILQQKGEVSFSVSQALDRSRDSQCDSGLVALKECNGYCREFNQRFDLVFLYSDKQLDIDIAFVKLRGDIVYIVPRVFLNIELCPDYSGYSPAELLSSRKGGKVQSETGLYVMGALTNTSQRDIKSRMEVCDGALKEISEDISDVKDAKVGDLAKLQAEIDEKVKELEAKKADLLAVLEAKKAEAEAALEKLKKQVYLLESEIYSIRCYLGETVDFVKLRGGNPAPVDRPVILYQKLRFLDEELGKLAGVYGVDYSDAGLFERFIANNPIAFETFCPTDKCVTVIKVSKSGLGYNGSFSETYGNILLHYYKYHGGKVGILVRNGDQLYVGWTDEEKIDIKEDTCYTPEDVTYTKDSEEEKTVFTYEDDKINTENAKKAKLKEAVSRYFVFSILQGVLENTEMLKIPAIESFCNPSKYIIYSVADGWIADNRFGTFRDIVSKCNEFIAEGHPVLMLNGLRDGTYESHSLYYQRDHNYSRRTGNVECEDGKIYNIKLAEEKPETYYESVHTEYYISLVKDGGKYVYSGGRFLDRKKDTHALFRVYPDEFINLNFMNTVWLKYVISNRALGFSGKEGNFAYMIKYLNRALDFVGKREVDERNLILANFPKLDEIQEWQVKLSEWKIANKVNNFTEWQAKRFAKTLQTP